MRTGPISERDLDEEITHRKQPSAQMRALDSMGIPYEVRPDKTPLVMWEWVADRHAAKDTISTNEPDFEAAR